MPKYFFKFVSFGEYTMDTLEKLIDSTIYAPSIEQLNDPFEGRWFNNQIDVQYPGEDKEFKGTLDRRSIYCLCSNGSDDFPCSSDSILMWSHYANSHTGFCIMFSYDVLKAEGQAEFSPMRVVYSDSMPEKTGKRDRDMIILCQKSNEWEKENEIRLCFKNKGHYKKIPKGCVRAIFAGCRISEMNDCLLYGVAQKLNCEYYNLKLNNQSFRFDKLKQN